MANPNNESELSSMFMQRGDGKRLESPTRAESSSGRGALIQHNLPAEVITVKDFFDFMRTAYQVYEHLEGDEDEGSKINWEELTKLTVLNHVIEQPERDLLYQTAFSEQTAVTSKSDSDIDRTHSQTELVHKRYSCSEIQGKDRRRSLPPGAGVEMLGVWTEANLNCKLNDVINEGILDSILPYLVGYKKPSKTTSVYAPIIKKSQTTVSTEIKKPASFGGFINEKESRDRLGRRKSSVAAAQERALQKQDGEVEIHVCDEVKGLKKDFRCPQKLLVTKMGYFAEVTAGQRLEDMDISVHCDIQIFEWLMRWVKRDTILVADWPLLDPHNVVPILVSASFLQMEPLLHDCLIYCHAHMSDIVKTSTNLACLSDALLTRLAAMYTNAELEAVRDRKDKVQSRLYCKLIASLAEPVPESLRGHFATLATLFKCSKCNKLLGRHIADQVPCQPSSMRIDRRGNVVSAHTKEQSWSLSEYIRWLYGELRAWRRVYWRLWADCHFLRCQLCDSYFPVYQMEWCSHHEPGALGAGPPPAARHACCGERAFRFETLARSTGCQFREHAAAERSAADAAVLALCARFRDLVALRPPPRRPDALTRLVPAEGGEETGGRVHCKEVFWWEGIQLAPPRRALGLLGKLYTGNTKFNPMKADACAADARPGAAGAGPAAALGAGAPVERRGPGAHAPGSEQGAGGAGCAEGAGDDAAPDSDRSERSSGSGASDEDAPRTRARTAPPPRPPARRGRAAGRVWLSAQSARSNQDAQRRYEERAAGRMRAALAHRHHGAPEARAHPGGVFARLEAQWREGRGAAGASASGARRGAASARRPAGPKCK